MLREVGGQLRRVLCLDQAGRDGRAIGTERGEDRVSLALDQLERLVALARPGQDGRDLLLRRGAHRGPEMGDRHDRDVADRRRGRRGRLDLARRRGWPGARGWKRGVRVGRSRGRGRCRDARTRRGRRAAAETELAAGDRQRDGQCEQAEDDERRTAFHGPDCDRGRGGRPPTDRATRPARSWARRTPRPGGRTGRREKRVDGGPDRIRTGDLQRDRLACWAATPRVQMWRGRSIAGGPGVVRHHRPVRDLVGGPQASAVVRARARTAAVDGRGR